MTRLRYKKVADNVLESHLMLMGHTIVKVSLNLLEMTYKLTDMEGNTLVSSEPFLNAISLKKAVKTYLIKNGTVFMDEVRKRRVNEQEITSVVGQNALSND